MGQTKQYTHKPMTTHQNDIKQVIQLQLNVPLLSFSAPMQRSQLSEGEDAKQGISQDIIDEMYEIGGHSKMGLLDFVQFSF